MIDSKKELRNQIKSRLKALSERERLERSGQALARLVQSPEYQSARTVLAYYSVDHEIDTHALLRKIIEAGKLLGLPRTKKEDCSMQFHAVSDLKGELETAHYRFCEPKATLPVVAPEEADLVVVPGFAFDEAGNRLGRGAGYYDRYLANTENTTVCALAFECQILNNIPAQTHDQPVQLIFTEGRTLRCTAR